MSPALIIDAALLAISLMITLILAVAWYDFDRPSHAQTWSIAFALLASIWAIEICARTGIIAEDSRAFAAGLAALASATNTIGFRQRAHWPARAAILIPTAALPLVGIWLLGEKVPGAAGLAPLDLYNGVMFALAARTLVGRRRSERAAQRTAYVGLVFLALLGFGLAATKALVIGGYYGHDLSWLGRVILPLMPAAVTGIGLFTIFLLAADLADQTRRLSATDMLSGLLNRRGFEGAAQKLLDAALAAGRRAALVLVDIDHFKDVNDSFGHPTGDRVLAGFARLLAAQAGRRDLLARVGGEEFALLIADGDDETGADAAEAIRARIAAHDFELPDGRRITASFGVAALSQGLSRLADLIARADVALYRAKGAGRDRVVIAGAEDVTGTAAR